MDTTTHTGTPLRQRMTEDMRMRKLEDKTQQAYIRAVRKLSVYLKRSPDTATVEDLRNFQLPLVDSGKSPITLNATLSGLRFFFDITLGRVELMARMQPVKLPRTLPVVLSTQEATRLIAAARSVKHQAAFRWLTAPACAQTRSAGSRSATSTASAWRFASSRARVPRTATPCLAPWCCSACARGGVLAMPRARGCPAVGCFRAWPCVVSINHFAADTDAEHRLLQERIGAHGVPVLTARHWAEGGARAAEVAREGVRQCEQPSTVRFAYDDGGTLWQEMERLAQRIYGASGISAKGDVKAQIQRLQTVFVKLRELRNSL